MKKIAAFLLAMMLALGLTTAFAEEEAKEIVWQDIPWGISYQETVKLLIEKKIIDSPENLKMGDYYQLSMMGIWANFLLENGEVDFYIFSPKYLNSGIIVATNYSYDLSFTYGGYPVRSITLTFSPDDQLMSIAIAPKDFNYDDLTKKLTTVYGEPSIQDPFVILGGNQTAISFDFNTESFVYGKTTWNEILSEPETETQAISDNVDLGGL